MSGAPRPRSTSHSFFSLVLPGWPSRKFSGFTSPCTYLQNNPSSHDVMLEHHSSKTSLKVLLTAEHQRQISHAPKAVYGTQA